jgi:hypothetical protein
MVNLFQDKTRLIAIYISILVSLNSVGQNLVELKQHLVNKDFTSLKTMVDKLPSKFLNSDEPYKLFGEWITLRDITPDFQEAVIELEERFTKEKQKASKTVLRYKLTILATKSNIVEYHLFRGESVISKTNDYYNIKWHISDSFINQQMFDSLQTSFNRIYKTTLNKKDLYIDNIIVGLGCGESVTAPEQLSQILTIAHKKDNKAFDSWLKSANVEKQIYALIGLYFMRKEGLKITEEQQKIIEQIKNKRGKINLCRGCKSYQDQIGEIVTKVLTSLDI